jgi:ParB/RepB/Spo0J family partition protein
MPTDSHRVLIAISDDVARTFLVDNLQADGYDAIAASSLGHARSRLTDDVHALIVDLGSDTTRLVEALRGGAAPDSWLPILAGSDSADLFYPIRLLERGADDVIYEPWSYLEVRARLAALLRRSNPDRPRQVLRTGSLRVDVAARRVWIGDTEIKLTGREFDLLRVLASEPDRVFTRSELLESVWGLGEWARTRTLDSHASRLRRQLSNVGGDQWVRNVWGRGYRQLQTRARCPCEGARWWLPPCAGPLPPHFGALRAPGGRGRSTGTIAVPLEEIHVASNVRDLDLEHVDALAGSIALQGLLVPVLIAPAESAFAEQGFDYELVAGYHRYAAVSKLQHSAIDAVIRDRDDDSDGSRVAAARATENITRKQLNAYEEALAVQAMLDRNLTEDGAAQALGWPKARVTARVKLLELPVAAQKLIGDGVIPLGCVDTLREVGKVSPDVLGEVVEYIANGGDWVVGRLQSETGWVIGRVLSETGSKAFAAYLNQIGARQIEELKLGKKATEQLAEIEELHKKVNRYSYGPPPIRFNEQDVDQARAAGVLIDTDPSPVIVDRPLYRELAKQALTRTLDEFREQAARLAEERKAGKRSGSTAGDPVNRAAEIKREHGRQTRQFAEQAHGVNVDLGWALRNELSVVDPTDINVARLFVYAALGSDYHSGYGTAGEKVKQLAMTGVRLVIEEFREDVTKTKKDGSRGALRISYGDQHKPEEQVAWMWKFLDGAKTAGELYGRALVVIAAEQYASRLVVPSSQQHRPLGWSSHKDQAAKALAKLAGPHLPASLKQLEKAIVKAKSEYDKQLSDAAQQRRSASDTATEPAPETDADDDATDPDEDELDELLAA